MQSSNQLKSNLQTQDAQTNFLSLFLKKGIWIQPGAFLNTGQEINKNIIIFDKDQTTLSITNQYFSHWKDDKGNTGTIPNVQRVYIFDSQEKPATILERIKGQTIRQCLTPKEDVQANKLLCYPDAMFDNEYLESTIKESRDIFILLHKISSFHINHYTEGNKNLPTVMFDRRKFNTLNTHNDKVYIEFKESSIGQSSEALMAYLVQLSTVNASVKESKINITSQEQIIQDVNTIFCPFSEEIKNCVIDNITLFDNKFKSPNLTINNDTTLVLPNNWLKSMSNDIHNLKEENQLSDNLIIKNINQRFEQFKTQWERHVISFKAVKEKSQSNKPIQIPQQQRGNIIFSNFDQEIQDCVNKNIQSLESRNKSIDDDVLKKMSRDIKDLKEEYALNNDILIENINQMFQQEAVKEAKQQQVPQKPQNMSSASGSQSLQQYDLPSSQRMIQQPQQQWSAPQSQPQQQLYAQPCIQQPKEKNAASENLASDSELKYFAEKSLQIYTQNQYTLEQYNQELLKRFPNLDPAKPEDIYHAFKNNYFPNPDISNVIQFTKNFLKISSIEAKPIVNNSYIDFVSKKKGGNLHELN